MVLVWSMLMSRRLSGGLFILIVGVCYMILLPVGGFVVIARCAWYVCTCLQEKGWGTGT